MQRDNFDKNFNGFLGFFYTSGLACARRVTRVIQVALRNTRCGFDHLNYIIIHQHWFLETYLSEVLNNIISKVDLQLMMGSSRNAGRKALADFFPASIPSGATGIA